MDTRAIPFDDSEENDEIVDTEHDPIVEIFDLLDQYEYVYMDYVDILKGLVVRMREESEEDNEEDKCKQRVLTEKLEELLHGD